MDLYAERGYRPSGNADEEQPGRAQELRERLQVPQIGEWCVCRVSLIPEHDDDAHPLNFPSDRAAGVMMHCGRSVTLCFDEEEPIFTCATEKEAARFAKDSPPPVHDFPAQTNHVHWRTSVREHHDGSCAVLYEGDDLFTAERWRDRVHRFLRGRKAYTVRCVVDGILNPADTEAALAKMGKGIQ